MMMCGGVSAPSEIDDAALAVWNEVIAVDSSLAALGMPISVQTQVVAGTNYTFSFADGQVVKIFHQPWTNTLEITEKPTTLAVVQPELDGMLCGGVSAPSEIDAEALAVWDEAVLIDPGLAALGAPISVQKQVVAGINYTFNFADGQIVKIFHQPWTNTLEITEKPVTMTAPQTAPTICGGVSAPSGVDDDALAVWNEAIAKDPSLAALGTPVSVQTQVVAGKKYIFTFANGQVVKIVHQPWKNNLQIVEKPATMAAAPSATASMLCGGVSAPKGVDGAALAVWGRVLEQRPDLASLGQPISVQTQVVAGAKYTFKFANNASVVVVDQPWTGMLQVLNVTTPQVSTVSMPRATFAPTASLGAMQVSPTASRGYVQASPTASLGAVRVSPTASFGAARIG